MNEITKITIDNFQSHKHTEIEPAPAGQLSCIIGPSDGGKTATLRAMRHNLYNLPLGTDFIRVGTHFSKVQIDYADGHSIIRSRSHKGLNRYDVIYPNKEPEKFEGFGNTVPLEVQEITGVRPVQIGDMTLNINLAEQLDGPFLGKMVSAPMKAKVLGKLAGTEEVDYAAKSVGTDLYRRRQDKERLGNDAARLETAIKEYAYLVELGKKIGQAEALLKGLREKTEKLKALQRLREQLAQIQIGVENAAQQIDRLTEMLHATMLVWNSAEWKIRECGKLQLLASQQSSTADALALVQATLDRTARIEEAGVLLTGTTEDADRLVKLVAARHEYAVTGARIANEETTLLRTKRIGEAELLLSCAAKCELRRQALRKHRDTLTGVNYEIEDLAAFLGATEGIEDAVVKARMLADDIALLSKLQGVSGQQETTQIAIGIYENRLKRLEGIDDAGTILDGAAEKLSRGKALFTASVAYRTNVFNLSSTVSYVQRFAADEERYCNEYKNTLLAAGVCPTCGSKVTSKTLKEAI